MRSFVVLIVSGLASAQDSQFASEFSKRWIATGQLMAGVAEAMPPGQYSFKPDPPSMNFGEQMIHIAWANYAFCAAIKNENPPEIKVPEMTSPTRPGKPPMTPDPAEKAAIVKYVKASVEYCTRQIAGLTDAQLNGMHATPDGRLSGRETLLALYVHMAHHRGQAEAYLRIKGIAPPRYVF